MIRPPVETLQYIDGEYTLARPPSPWRRWVRRVGCWAVVVVVCLLVPVLIVLVVGL